MNDKPRGAPADRDTRRYRSPPLGRSLIRTLLVFAGFVAVALAAHFLMDWVMAESEKLGPRMGRMVRWGLVATMLVAYGLLIAVPFVPGIEIGLSLLMIRGAEVAPFVYAATLGGLTLAYAAGRALPYDWLRRLFLDLRLTRACILLDRIQPLSPERRLALLRRQLPRRLGSLAVGCRYPLLALLINMPGSGLIGGGGGIALVAGLTRLYRPRATVLTFALAVAPFPLLVWLYGPGLLS